jgi:hypothetical protein
MQKPSSAFHLSNEDLGALLVAATIMSGGVAALWLHSFAGLA